MTYTLEQFKELHRALSLAVSFITRAEKQARKNPRITAEEVMERALRTKPYTEYEKRLLWAAFAHAQKALINEPEVAEWYAAYSARENEGNAEVAAMEGTTSP